MSDLLHSFVVPAYGRSPHLRDCLESLRRQSLPSRLFIATSTPHDGLAEIAREYGAALAVHAPNAGIGRDWNHALAQADTPWLTVAHQDDIYLPEFTRRTLDAAASRPDAALLFTGYAELLADSDAVRDATAMLRIKRLLLELAFLGRDAVARPGAKLRALRFGCPIPCPSVTLARRSPPFRFREDLRVNLDWDAWVRCAREPGAFVYIRESLMLHRIHPGSETSAGVRDGVRAAEDQMMFDSLWPKPIARMLARAYRLSYAGAER